MLTEIGDVYAAGELIIKVNEPIKSEYPIIKEDQVLFTYFHFASGKELTLAMLNSKSVCIAYETVEDADGTLSLLTPM